MSEIDLTTAVINEPLNLKGLAAKGEEITTLMLSEDIGGGWRFGDLLTLAMQVALNLPPVSAAPRAAQALERVLHNSFVKAGILHYDEPPTAPKGEEIGP